MVRGIPINKAANDARLARGEIKEIRGSKIERNGIARRKRLRGVDCQTTTASGIPVNNTTLNASMAPARMTCPASVKSDCAAIASFTAGFCNRMKKKKAMTNEPIAAEKILVN